MNEAKIQISK